MERKSKDNERNLILAMITLVERPPKGPLPPSIA